MSVQISMNVSGVKEIRTEVRAMEKSMKKSVRRGVTKATRLLRGEVKRNIPKDLGLTRKRLDMVVRTYPNGVVVGVVGIKKGATEIKTAVKVFRMIGNKVVHFPRPKSNMERKNPQYTWHLLELGFTRADGRRFPPLAPLRRAHAAKKAEMERIIRAEVDAGLTGAVK